MSHRPGTKYDVFIVEIATRKIDSIIGEDMDSVLDRSEKSGRNTAELRVQTGNERVNDRLALEHALRRALERQEFALHYQQKLREIKEKYPWLK